MWNVLRHQIRSYVENLRKQKENALNGPQLTLRRVPVQISVSQGLSGNAPALWGFAYLNDINLNGMYVFSPVPFGRDQIVSITLEEPRRFFARTRVISCQDIKTESKVITEARPTMRLALEFLADNDEDRAAFKAFADEVREKHLFRQRAA